MKINKKQLDKFLELEEREYGFSEQIWELQHQVLKLEREIHQLNTLRCELVEYKRDLWQDLAKENK